MSHCLDGNSWEPFLSLNWSIVNAVCPISVPLPFRVYVFCPITVPFPFICLCCLPNYRSITVPLCPITVPLPFHYQVLGTKYLVPSTSTWYLVQIVLGTKCLVLGTWYQVLGTKYLVLGTKYLVFGTKYLVLGTKYLVLGTKCLVLGTKYLVLGTKYLVLGTIRSNSLKVDLVKSRSGIMGTGALVKSRSRLK